MYTAIYLYRVAHQHLDAFLQVKREVPTIYRNYGALGDITLIGTNLEAKYGFLAFDVTAQEVVLVGLSSFRDKAHFDEVMLKINADDKMDKLNHELTTFYDVKRVVRGEFERVV